MNLKLFYSPPKWFAFIAPEKPKRENYELAWDYEGDYYEGNYRGLGTKQS